MKYLIIPLILIHFLPLQKQGLYIDCHWYNYLTYAFFHGNILHLAINTYSIHTLSKSLQNKITIPRQIILFLTLNILSAIISNNHTQPTYGCSSGIYGILGYWAYMSSKTNPYISLNIFTLTMITMLITIPITNIDTMLHLTAFSLGCTISLLSSIARPPSKTHNK